MIQRVGRLVSRPIHLTPPLNSRQFQHRTFTMTSPSSVDQRPTFFFDLDNCLYSKDRRIGVLMGKLISKYFQEHLELSVEDAETLHQQYYTMYGLALEGLVRHHKIGEHLILITSRSIAIPTLMLFRPPRIQHES